MSRRNFATEIEKAAKGPIHGVVHWGRAYAGCPTNRPHPAQEACYAATGAFVVEGGA